MKRLFRRMLLEYSVLFCIWIYFCSANVPSVAATAARTVSIGVIVDSVDDRSAAINRSIEIAMTVSNKTRHVKMNPIRNKTDLRDSFQLRQTICSLIEKQPIALFGTSRSETFNIIESYSRALRMPFFLPTLTRETTTNKDNYIISMCPSFVDAVIDFIKYFHWNRIFYIFDTDDALWRLQKVYQAFSDRFIDGRKQEFLIDAIRLPDVSNCREILRKLDRNYNFNTKRIVVDLYSTQDYDKFMSQVIDVGMNRDGYHYLLGTLDISGMNKELWRSFMFGGVNITGFQLVKSTHRHSALTELLEEQELSVEVALTVDAVAVLTTALVQIVHRPDRQKILGFGQKELVLHMNCSSEPIQSLPKGRVILEYILNVTMDGSSEGLSGKIAFDEFGNRKDYSLNIFHMSYRTPLHQVGYWEHNIGLRDISLEPGYVVEDVKPLNRTRIVTTIINEPFIQEVKSMAENGKPRIGNDRFEGYCIDMIKMVSEMANFTYNLKIVADQNYGTRNESTGHWNGLIGELLRGEADIALASLTITHKREQAVYFTKPFMNTGISIMIKKPEREKPGVFSFMDPLSLKVWGCVIGGFFAVSFILYMVGRFSPLEWQEDNNTGVYVPSNTYSFFNTMWFSLGALMQQGPDIYPRSLSGRVLASAWWFFTLITISSYTANLAAFLTFEKLTPPVASVDDLVKQSKIKYGCQKRGSTYEFFKDSKVTIYQQMFHVMEETIPSVYVDNAETGWQRVISERGEYAFLLESSSNNYFNQRKPCKTMRIGRNLDQKGYGIALPKFSDLSHPINIAVLEMREKGDLLKLEQKWWYSKGECGGGDSAEKGKNALNLSNVSGIFHILIGGLVLAMVISLTQIVLHSRLKRRPRKYATNNTRASGFQYGANYGGPSYVETVDTSVIHCTTSNGGEPHLLRFADDNPDNKIISLDDDNT